MILHEIFHKCKYLNCKCRLNTLVKAARVNFSEINGLHFFAFLKMVFAKKTFLVVAKSATNQLSASIFHLYGRQLRVFLFFVIKYASQYKSPQ